PRQSNDSESKGRRRVPRIIAVEKISERVCQARQPVSATRRRRVHERAFGETDAGNSGDHAGHCPAPRHRIPAGASRRVLRNVRQASDRQTGAATRRRILGEGEKEPGKKRPVRNPKSQIPNPKQTPRPKRPTPAAPPPPNLVVRASSGT